MKVEEALRLAKSMLLSSKITSSGIDSTLLLEHVSGKPKSWLMAHPEYELSLGMASKYFDLIKERRDHTPLVHLTNKREFYGLDFYIDKHVLTPRVETEKMVEWAVADAPQGSRLIDIGTGSGALAVAIAKHRPDLNVTATDVSVEALAVAKRNAKTHNVEIEFVESDLWKSIGGKFETIVTNLPYLNDDAELMPEVKKEPAVALFGGPDGLNLYRQFLTQLPKHLSDGGLLLTECDPWQHDGLIVEASKYGLVLKRSDYFILEFRHSA